MAILLDTVEMHDVLRTMARGIAATAPNGSPLAIVGIRRRGEVLAQRLIPLLHEIGVRPAHSGALDITLYRDDLSAIGPQAVVRATEIDFDVAGAYVVLVDDVLYTGRSVRAALDALTDLGRAKAIRLAVLVDRGWRELPIHADVVGMKTETEPYHIVKVRVAELDGVDEVELHDTRGE